MSRLLDLHVHPSLKMHYLPYLTSNFHAKVYSGNHWNPFSFRTQYSHLKNSPAKIMLATHYVIEPDFVTGAFHWYTRAAAWTLGPYIYHKLRSADVWETLQGMIATQERAVKNTNRTTFGDGPRFRMVRRFSEIDQVKDNEIGLVHTVEGSHALGFPKEGESLEAFWERVQQRLAILKEQGVALITLAHFADNMFSPQTEGTEYIPKEVNGKVVSVRDNAIFQMKRATWRWGDPNKLSVQFASKMLELGMLIDISHTQEHARHAIYELCADYERPVIASHVGLQHFFDHEYNLSDDELRTYHKIGGVAGLILSRRWLVDPLKRHGTDGKGIDDLVENMLYIADLLGDVSVIGIGTDFDGLTDPLKDCYHYGQLDRLVDRMTHYFNDRQIDDILYGNSLRALDRGWGQR